MRKITQFWQFAIVLYIITFPLQVFSQTATPPAVGDGSENNPYEIATLENLYWLTQSDTVWDKHFIQTEDIDALLSINWDNESGFTPIGNPTMPFIGSYNGKRHVIDRISINRSKDKYIGLFGYVGIDAQLDSLGLTNINILGYQYVGGLTGYLDKGQIACSFSTGTSNCIAGYIGGLVGLNSGNISLCYSSVNVSSIGYVGGLVGLNAANGGTITQCYSQGNVTGNNTVGGLIGNNSSYSGNYCYSRSWVNAGGYSVGGLTGIWDAKFSFWDVEKSEQTTSGGGVGLTTLEMQDSLTYLNVGWDFINETTNGTNDIWGMDSSNNDGYPYLKWQEFTSGCQCPFFTARSLVFGNKTINSINLDSIVTSGYSTSGYCIYINTEDSWSVPIDGTEPTANTSWQNTGQQCIYFGASNNLNITITGLSESTRYYFKVYTFKNCSGTESYEQNGILVSQYTKDSFIVPEGNGSEGNPYEIANSGNLVWLMKSDSVWEKYFIQTEDIDASLSINWDEGKGFIPIGNETIPFIGTYNGMGHIIDQINIKRSEAAFVGLFGYLNTNARIENLGLSNIDIIGKSNGYVGGIAGYISANDTSANIITKCYSQGNLIGGTKTGGLVGSISGGGKITHSYSLGTVTGNSYAGGIAGYNMEGKIQYCYSSSIVRTPYTGGGLVGGSLHSFVDNCFWDIETSGQSSSMGGGTGLTTIEMQDVKTYLNASWDFMDETINGTEYIWGLNATENEGYPFLHWQGYTNVELECQAPFFPADNIIFSNILGRSITIKSYTESGYGTIGYVIYLNTEDSWTVLADGTEPTADTHWQSSGQQCVYVGSSNNPNITITGLLVNTNYYFKIYAFNDCNGTKTYEHAGVVSSQSTFPVEGDGSTSNPYQIETLENLYWLTQNYTAWNKYFIQTANIDASVTIDWDEGRGFTPIGNSTTAFSGSYNGKGFIIDQININRPSDSLIGLFGKTNNAYIDSLGITNINIKGSRFVGGLAGHFHGGQITNCYTTGTSISNLSSDWWVKIGGLVGYNSGKINFCYSEVDVSSSYGIVGGLVGSNTGTIIESYSQGDITGSSNIGGLVGNNIGLISLCYSDVTIFSNNNNVGGLVGSNSGTILESNSHGDMTGYSNLGGLAGYSEGSISFCFSDVNVSSNSDFVGGLVGVNDDFILCSYSKGNVIGNNYVGGLAGYNGGSISFCFSDVNVSSYNDILGGLVGINYEFISCSYSAGNVTGNNYVGGLVGVNLNVMLHSYSRSYVKANNSLYGGLLGDNYGYVASCFWDTEASGQNTSIGGEGLTTLDMQNIKPYFNSGWDFMDEWTNGSGDYWGLNSNENEGYPFLYWQGYAHTATIPTDINGIENTNISIYPNPVSEVLNITTSGEGINRLVITDINGKKIIEKNVVNRTEQIDMSSLNSGIYLINIYKGNEVYTSKIIKK